MKNQSVDFPQILKELQAQQPGIALSITMPTAQMMPDKLQDRIRLKDLVAKAYQKLSAQYPERDFSKLQNRVEKLIENYQFDIESKGLALLAHESYGTIIRLPFAIPAEMHVDSTFHISTLLRLFAHSNPYWILAITKKMCRLYEAHDHALQEVITPTVDALGNPVQGFPLDYVAPRDGIERAVGQGDKDSKHVEGNEKHYFMMVDAELGKKLNEKRMPVVVCGVEKNISMFKQLTKHSADIVGYQHGDFNNHLDLAQAVAPVLAEHRRQETKKLLERFVESEGQLHQAFGMHRVWLMAREGRIDYLLVEEGLVVPGTVNPTNRDQLILADKLMPEKKIDNLVDALIAQVIATRGKIVFLPKDSLKKFEHVGAILRY